MCGRFAIADRNFLPRGLNVREVRAFEPRYNIAPSQQVPVIQQLPGGDNIIVLAEWGLIPSWVKNPAEIAHPINAKAETVAIKPMFRHAFKSGRVLVPASAFYEWEVIARGKQPWLIRVKGGEPFAFGGLLESWSGPEGERTTFTILTTSANALMKPIHDRMPVIVRPEGYQTWLDPTFRDVHQLLGLTLPFPEKDMEAWPVSTRVNNPRHEGPEIMVPATPLGPVSSTLLCQSPR